MVIESLMQTLPVAGRILVGFFFFFFGIWNAMHWSPTLAFMKQKKLPCASPLFALGIGWQSIFGLLVMLGIWVQYSALLLIPFDVVAVVIFHAFWNFNAEIRRLNLILFVSNLSVSLGALCLLASGG